MAHAKLKKSGRGNGPGADLGKSLGPQLRLELGAPVDLSAFAMRATPGVGSRA